MPSKNLILNQTIDIIVDFIIWQGRILDLFLYSIDRQYLPVSNPCGEMVCLYTRMDYLREEMPFDRILT
ncbi:MAG: hypothetical protein O4861_08000 [Trichodesmium sp. St16_bin4-tuft]|nr:hypothetical protein [Trichodesmium sp. MAG_R01]MDE5069651.1 hypothetical protein [Trichodesmium sp. St4_bin8_1]MDE5071293.1 hypothetical protein [Trichodesmium sp. St5_bin8]MDE5098278.1 hypothetical protein [Trichodesmium sp. St16_bin4-tuft]MDE5105142.1 hypothetical protein [Trichodesmium sp. St19_bin2]